MDDGRAVQRALIHRVDWMADLKEGVYKFLQTIKISGQPGRFLPSLDGLTEEGKTAALGFSCFALKIYYTLRLWDELSLRERTAWIGFLKSFQSDNRFSNDKHIKGAFIDPVIIESLNKAITGAVYNTQRAIIAETKQAIATLAQVGETSNEPYSGFPTSPEDLKADILQKDWSRPWGAGGQTAALAVFLKTQSPRFLSAAENERLIKICKEAFDGLADPRTGAYYTGKIPVHGELINGAMKVLTALDWLEAPIRYPEQLIDTSLQRIPVSEGCHLVNVVYVLYRCLQQTQYKKERIKGYCEKILDMIEKHHNADGGFSYYVGRSQTHYYGVPVTKGFAESDIHGTCLLAWAIAMILEIIEADNKNWRVIKP